MPPRSEAQGPKGDKLLRKKFHSEAETALWAAKSAARAVNVMKTMLQAAKSGYCTSVASEMSPKIGPEGDKIKKNMTQNSTLRPKFKAPL